MLGELERARARIDDLEILCDTVSASLEVVPWSADEHLIERALRQLAAAGDAAARARRDRRRRDPRRPARGTGVLASAPFHGDHLVFVRRCHGTG
jgi:hypothetical protein